jgi:hypothetical protein
LGYESVCLDRPMALGASGLNKDHSVGVFGFLTLFSTDFSHLDRHSSHICYIISNGSFLSFHLKM